MYSLLVDIMRGFLLSDLRDKKFFEKIVGKDVYSVNGEKIGKIWKIYISKRTKIPLKVVIKKKNGEKVSVDPEKLRVEKNKILIFSKPYTKISYIMARLDDIVENIKKLKEELFILDENFILNSSVTYEEYIQERKRIDKERINLLLEAKNLVEILNSLIEEENLFIDLEERKKIYEILDILENDLIVLPTDLVINSM